MKTQFWKIYSYWVFAMTILWGAGVLPFSPLVSAGFSLVASLSIMRDVNTTNAFILASHILPIWFLRRTKIEFVPNLIVFLVYNIFLKTIGTDFLQLYTQIYQHMPTTLGEYIDQRI